MMIIELETSQGKKKVDLDQPLDISVPIRTGPESVKAWYVDEVRMEPIRKGGFVGSIAEGGPVNFRDIKLNPHGNGTHTECVGHISKEVHSIDQHWGRSIWEAMLISIEPTILEEAKGKWEEGDQVIPASRLKDAVGESIPQALIVRTLPNPGSKQDTDHSGKNPPFFDPEGMEWLRKKGVQHFLVDLPSVDKEEDGGALSAHKAFWNYPEAPVFKNTITELIYVPDTIPDGRYLLELQVAAFENDAAPSRPVLYGFME